MLSDRAMWASVVIVDHLRNGVPLEDASRNHAARSLAALMNVFRLPMDEYWERQMEMTDGVDMMLPLMNTGFSGLGVPSELDGNREAIAAALSERSWESLRRLPDPVWRLLRAITGMTRDEWEGLPDYCRDLMSERVVCPGCDHAASMETFGEPNPIDDPTYFNQQRISLVFRCPKCGTEVRFSIPTGASRESRTVALPRGIAGWVVIGSVLVLAAVLLWMIVTRPTF